MPRKSRRMGPAATKKVLYCGGLREVTVAGVEEAIPAIV
jgi:hypothetical protein